MSWSNEIGGFALHQPRGADVVPIVGSPVDDEKRQLPIDVKATAVGQRSTDCQALFKAIRDLSDKPVADDRTVPIRHHGAPFE
jgi:hypothetical protein